MAFQQFPSEEELTRFFEIKPERDESVLFYKREHNGETLECEFSPSFGSIRFILIVTAEQRPKAEIYLQQVQKIEIVKQMKWQYLEITFDPISHVAGFVLSLTPDVYFRWGTT